MYDERNIVLLATSVILFCTVKLLQIEEERKNERRRQNMKVRKEQSRLTCKYLNEQQRLQSQIQQNNGRLGQSYARTSSWVADQVAAMPKNESEVSIYKRQASQNAAQNRVFLERKKMNEPKDLPTEAAVKTPVNKRKQHVRPLHTNPVRKSRRLQAMEQPLIETKQVVEENEQYMAENEISGNGTRKLLMNNTSSRKSPVKRCESAIKRKQTNVIHSDETIKRRRKKVNDIQMMDGVSADEIARILQNQPIIKLRPVSLANMHQMSTSQQGVETNAENDSNDMNDPMNHTRHLPPKDEFGRFVKSVTTRPRLRKTHKK